MNYTFTQPRKSMVTTRKEANIFAHVLGGSRNISLTPPAAITTITPTPPPREEIKPKKVWGKKIWTGLHAMIEQMSDTFFLTHRGEVFDIVIKICFYLPCSNCSEDAKLYLNKINFHLIQTRQDLRYMLFEFHNHVNKKKGYPIFLLEQLAPTYMGLNLMVALTEMIDAYLDKSKNSHQLASKMIRDMNANAMKVWFDTHYQAAYLS